MIALETGADNRIRRLHPHDPSWQNWPLLERAVLGNIVPDFPLINKSFNLSYSGQDCENIFCEPQRSQRTEIRDRES